MTPETRLLLANDRIAQLHRERAADRLARRTTVIGPRRPALLLDLRPATLRRRIAGSLAGSLAS